LGDQAREAFGSLIIAKHPWWIGNMVLR
jgi:hypothetical protein